MYKLALPPSTPSVNPQQHPGLTDDGDVGSGVPGGALLEVHAAPAGTEP